MNPGVRPGFKNKWYDYKPTLYGVVHTGGSAPASQPDIGNGTIWGSYRLSPTGVVDCKGGIVFGSSSTFGSGDDLWIISLPYKLYKWTGSSVNPTGVVLLWQGSSATPSYTKVGLATNLEGDFVPFATGDNNDSYFSIGGINPVSNGTGTITNATPATITHNLGMTPTAYDITITPTSLTAGSAAPGMVYVDTITSTQFNVNTQNALGASKSLGFSWKADALPSGAAGDYYTSNVGSKKPWTWASGHSITWTMSYESRQ